MDQSPLISWCSHIREKNKKIHSTLIQHDFCSPVLPLNDFICDEREQWIETMHRELIPHVAVLFLTCSVAFLPVRSPSECCTSSWLRKVLLVSEVQHLTVKLFYCVKWWHTSEFLHSPPPRQTASHTATDTSPPVEAPRPLLCSYGCAFCETWYSAGALLCGWSVIWSTAG